MKNQYLVIPGLTRNPVLFQSITLLDAGSSPAWQTEFKRFFELRHSLESRNPVISIASGLQCLSRTPIRGSPAWRDWNFLQSNQL